MIFDDGVVFPCRLENQAENGDMPEMVLVPFGKYWYGERTVGYNRQYLAKGVNEQVDMLIRIHHTRAIRIGNYAVLGNGEQFRITNVSMVTDENNLRYTDLTLQRLDENYEVKDDFIAE